MAKLVVVRGDRFNSLTVVEEVQTEKGKRRRFRCQCDCGNETEVDLNRLTTGRTKTCGRCNYKPVLIGDRYGHWTVIGDYIRNGKCNHREYLCQCDCHKKTIRYVDEQNLKSGKSISCGCVTAEVVRHRRYKHGDAKTRLFSIWNNMKGRCNNAKNERYKDYGGRGIKVCDEWEKSYEAFKEWALDNGYNDNLTIDRIDVNGNYCPNNCRWATLKEQGNNKRNNVRIEYNGESHTISEWACIVGIDRRVISSRYRKGYPLEDVFFCGNFDTKKRRIQ